MSELKTDYKDQLLDTSVNTERKFNLVDSDGNVVANGISLKDITSYSQEGDSFGAADLNRTNSKINDLTDSLGEDENGMTVHDKLDVLLNGGASGRELNILYSKTFSLSNEGVETVEITEKCTLFLIAPNDKRSVAHVVKVNDVEIPTRDGDTIHVKVNLEKGDTFYIKRTGGGTIEDYTILIVN